MGGLFSSKPKVQPAPVAPAVDNSAQLKMEAAAEEQRQAASRGRSSTILTGGTGVEDMGISTKKVLGQ